MQNTPNPETFHETLARIGISDALEGYVDPTLIRRWGLELADYTHENGFRVEYEGGNIYGRIKLVPIEPAAPASVLRLITRSDHAAVYGTRRAA